MGQWGVLILGMKSYTRPIVTWAEWDSIMFVHRGILQSGCLDQGVTLRLCTYSQYNALM